MKVLRKVVGKRLTYNKLIGKVGTSEKGYSAPTHEVERQGRGKLKSSLLASDPSEDDPQ